MRYKITLAYNGSAFCGWQIQSRDRSVQGCLQDALGMLLGCPTGVVGAGRTDTGVNASDYVAHFDSPKDDIDCAHLAYKLNAILPKEIAVYDICAVDDDFHARFGAKKRQYQYHIHSRKDPFRNAFSWYCRYPLDLDAMNRACSYLLGVHDCSCFEKKGSDNSTSICEIFAARWEEDRDCNGARTNGAVTFTVEANRFLRNMVRAIVGTMVDIGRGVHKPEYILEILDGKGERGDAGQSVPGHALFLTKIDY